MAPTAKIRRALKTAAKLPLRVPASMGSAMGMINSTNRNALAPQPGEPPIVIFRVQVFGCKDLLSKDRNGFSDPFVTLTLLTTRYQTPVEKKTVNPVYSPSEATFDFPVYLSLADRLGAIELVVWDKDTFSRKDYLGELALPLEQWFARGEGGRGLAFDDPNNEPLSLSLVSSRANTTSQGSIQLKIGFANAPGTQTLMSFEEVYNELVRRSRPSLVSAPPTEGVGTVRSHQGGPEFEDDGGLSSDEDEEEEEEENPAHLSNTHTQPLTELYTPPGEADKPQTQPQEDKVKEKMQQPHALKVPPPELNIQPSSPMSPIPDSTLGDKTPVPVPTPAVTPTQKSSGFIPRMKFPRKLSGLTTNTKSSTSSSGSAGEPTTPTTPAPLSARTNTSGSLGLSTPLTTPVSDSGAEKERKKRFRKSWGEGEKKKREYAFGGGNDIVGIVMLEIQGAEDLPRLKNMTRTGWDMDPFVVISFGKKVFRTRVVRHSRNPVWDEKLLFHVRRYETSFKVQLTLLDWDKLSANDHIGDTNFDVKDLVASAPQPNPETGLYAADAGGDHPMREMKLHITTAKEAGWESKHNPVITVRAKYQPYDALRQRFWRQYLKQYDTDDTNTISQLELTSMLDSLGSTLTRATITSFFTRYGKDAHTEELTMEEAIQCLETELGRPDSEKRRVDEDSMPDTSASVTPVLMVADGRGKEIELDQLDFSGPKELRGSGSSEKPPVPGGFETEPMQQSLHDASAVPRPGIVERQISDSSSDGDLEEDLSGSGSGSGSNLGVPPTPTTKKNRFRVRGIKKKRKSDGEAEREDNVERVINVKNCPLCHRPRMTSKAEMDIVTHLAVCASQDWNKVDQIMVGNFVTASQAQRKWYTKIISKISSGDYKLGANSANIIVQNRMTGQLEEEKMQVYVRLGIRLLYKGMKSRMEGGRARRLLKSMSIKQGVKYDSPESAQEIIPFVEFHRLNVNEILKPIDSFKTFNEFFYRKLKPDARPVENPEDPYRLVSVADCRIMTFETVSEATRLWIKGREFTVARLLGDVYKDQAERYNGGAVGIFRLAPQDYHRFHSPVDGTIGPMTYIAGEYYTVNPQAIRTALDVYGENARKIVPIDSPQFGRVMAVCVGAMMVGSIKTTVEEGEQVKRGQEFGYFAFGGSTIVLLFEKGALKWDEDLLINGRASLETLVRVGMGVGKGTRSA
ncbi:phosphatidylserine decarboxylase-domain-containing protein [Cyathus striatus]|nr:phosphatidylserine decarboxylase-domain-containing protein [Cyathus striatus]